MGISLIQPKTFNVGHMVIESVKHTIIVRKYVTYYYLAFDRTALHWGSYAISLALSNYFYS